jgi:hypothetical protein
MSPFGDINTKGDTMAGRSRPKGTQGVVHQENRALRESTGLTQEQFGKQVVGHGRQFINMMEQKNCEYCYDEDEKHKVREYLNKPILRAPATTTRLSFRKLKDKYHAEENWVDEEHGLPFIAIFPLMDQPPILLTKAQVIGNTIHAERFQIPPAKLPENVCTRIIESYRMMLPKDARLHDEETKARLINAKYDDNQAILQVHYGITNYYNSLITQRLADYQLLWPDEQSLENPRTLGDIFAADPGDGHLPPLSVDSPLANITGRGALVFTRDQCLILVLRSNNVVADAGTYDLAIQGSGDIDTEFTQYDVFRDFRHEAKEELNCDMQHGWERFSDGTEAIFVLGLIRNAAQAGKPDFLFLAKSTYTAEQLKKKAVTAKDWWENKQLIALPPTTPIENLYERLSSTSNHSPTCRATISLLLRWTEKKDLRREDTVSDISTALFG